MEGVYAHLLSFSPLPCSFRSQSLFSVFLCHLREAAREAQQNRSNRDHNCSCSVQRQRAPRPSTSCSIIIMWHATHAGRIMEVDWRCKANTCSIAALVCGSDGWAPSDDWELSLHCCDIRQDRHHCIRPKSGIYILDLTQKFGARPTGIIDLAMQHINRHQCHHLPKAILTPANQPSCSISLQKRRG